MLIRDEIVRQVDLDELTYQIFSGLRSWSPSVLKRVFAPIAKRHDADVRIAAERVCATLSAWDFIDPASPSLPLSLTEVSQRLVPAIEKFPGAIPALWQSGVREREREAMSAAATLLAAALEPLEILSTATLHQHGVRTVWFRMPEAPAHAFAPRWP